MRRKDLEKSGNEGTETERGNTDLCVSSSASVSRCSGNNGGSVGWEGASWAVGGGDHDGGQGGLLSSAGGDSDNGGGGGDGDGRGGGCSGGRWGGDGDGYAGLRAGLGAPGASGELVSLSAGGLDAGGEFADVAGGLAVACNVAQATSGIEGGENAALSAHRETSKIWELSVHDGREHGGSDGNGELHVDDGCSLLSESG